MHDNLAKFAVDTPVADDLEKAGALSLIFLIREFFERENGSNSFVNGEKFAIGNRNSIMLQSSANSCTAFFGV